MKNIGLHFRLLNLSSLLLLQAGLWHFKHDMSRGDTPDEGRDGMSTPQDGAAAYSQFRGDLPLPSVRFSSSWVSFSYGIGPP